jgi:clan AA aspartic protease
MTQQVNEDTALYETLKSKRFKSWNDMGRVYAEIEVVHYDDLSDARRGRITPDQVRRMHITAMVDSGADYFAINEHIQNQLQLPVNETRVFELADGSEISLEIVGPVWIHFENRRATVDAVVLPGNTEPLLGAVPMEIMDVIIHPKSQILTVNPENPIIAKHSLK